MITARGNLLVMKMLTALFLLLFPMCSLFTTAQAMDLFIGTEEKGSLSYYTGRTLCRIVQSTEQNISCHVEAGDGSVSGNLVNLQNGALDLALVDSGVLNDAVTKSGTFQYQNGSFDQVSYLLPLYKKHISLVVRKYAHIKTLDDLAGKRFNMGEYGSQEHAVSQKVMTVKNWSGETFSLLEALPQTHSQDLIAFNRGSVQAMFHVGVHPDERLERLFKANEGMIINFDDIQMDHFIENNPGYFFMHIPANVYPHQTQRITTYGTEVALLANDDLDNKTIQTLLEGLMKKQAWLRKSHSSLSEFNMERSWQKEPPVKYHPAAKEFITH